MAEIIVTDLSINTGDNGISAEEFIDALKDFAGKYTDSPQDYYLRWQEA